MKIVFELNAKEVMEAEVAFGVHPLVEYLVCKQVGEGNYKLLHQPDSEFGKVCNYSELELTLNKLSPKMSDLVQEVWSILFNFDGGIIDRAHGCDEVYFSDGHKLSDFPVNNENDIMDAIVNDIGYKSPFDSKIYKSDDIVYGTLSLSLGDAMKEDKQVM